MSLKYEHLIGQPFLWGVRDCFTVVREIYSLNFGIEITNYARPTDWSSDMRDLIRSAYLREGFVMVEDWRVDELRPGDVLCLALGESTGNHFAVYVGDNTIMHHLYHRLSSSEVFRDFWRNSVCYVLRHPEVPDLRPEKTDVTIMEILNARNPFKTAEASD